VPGSNGRIGATGDPGRRPFGGRSISALLGEIARAPDVDVGEASARLRPGVIVEGRFEIVGEIGRGGFGVVYEARDLSLGRTVAFKAAAGLRKSALREERLLREAAAAAKLSHPNIVQVHDLGHSEYGPYLVLEMLRGVTLDARLARGALPAQEALHIARDLAAGLGHAHAAGVVHRDLKPSNVVVLAGGHAKILDFGLARAFGQRSLEAGTPAYMAPEQWRGAPEDERTDVFAMGVILFEMLTGELPFPGEKGARDARTAPVLDVPEIPELGLLVQRMLARDPVDRPRDGAAVGRELDEMGLVSDTTSSVDRDRPRARRRPRLRSLAWLGLALATGAAVGAVVQHRVHGKAPVIRVGRTTLLVADPANSTGEPELDAVSPLLVTALEQSRALDVRSRQRVVDLAEQSPRGFPGRVDQGTAMEVGRSIRARLVLLPEVRRSGRELLLRVRALEPERGDSQFVVEERGREREAVTDVVDRLAVALRQALQETGEEAEASNPVLGSSLTRNLEAYRHYLLGQQIGNEWVDIPAALAEYKAALAADPDFALPHLEIAVLAGWHDAPEEDAAAHMAAAARNAAKLPDKERRLMLGYRAFVEKRYGEAMRVLDALALDHPQDKQVLYLAGEAFWHGQSPAGPAHAASLFRAALDLDPASVVPYIHLFTWLDRFGPADEGLSRAERAARVRPTPLAQAMAARALAARGRLQDGLEAARGGGQGSGGVHFESSCAYAEILFLAGRRDEAEQELRRWLRPSAAPGQRRVAGEILAVQVAAQGRRREAREILDSIRTGGAGQQYDTWDAKLAAHLELAGGDRAAALAMLREAKLPSPGSDAEADEMAWFWTWLGDPAEGQARAGHLVPGSTPERLHAGALALAEGRHAEAAAILGELTRRDPALEPAYLRGEALARAGRHAEALHEFETVKTAYPIYGTRTQASLQPMAALEAARSLERLGRIAEAREDAAELVALWGRAEPDLPALVAAREMQQRLAGR
jgi:tetratricopeptide (TPR) repeat protein